MSETNDPYDISPDEELIEVEIDGLLTPVEKAQWEANQDEVTAKVIEARASLRLEAPIKDDYQDYDALVAAWGTDGGPDDEVE